MGISSAASQPRNDDVVEPHEKKRRHHFSAIMTIRPAAASVKAEKRHSEHAARAKESLLNSEF